MFWRWVALRGWECFFQLSYHFTTGKESVRGFLRLDIWNAMIKHSNPTNRLNKNVFVFKCRVNEETLKSSVPVVHYSLLGDCLSEFMTASGISQAEWIVTEGAYLFTALEARASNIRGCVAGDVILSDSHRGRACEQLGTENRYERLTYNKPIL